MIRGVLAGFVGFWAVALESVAQSPPEADVHAAALAKVLPAVVRIEAIQLRPDQGRMIKVRVGGSGVIISPQGHVLTNYHVAQDADYYRCYLTDGTKLEARRVGQDPLTDLAVLQLDLTARPADAGTLPVASYGDSDGVATGDVVFALGSPATLSQSVTRGIVSNPSLVLPEEIKIVLDGENVGALVRWIFHDASIFPGNSGGPLVNARGEIIGVNEIGIANLGGAIPGNLARQVADQLIDRGKVIRGWSGLTVQPRLAGDSDAVGVLVSDVAPGSPASQAGLVAGDVVVACDNHPIEGVREKAVVSFNRLESGRLPGDDFAVEVERTGPHRIVHLKLAARLPAQGDDVELRGWGAVVRDITPQVAREEQLPDTRGVWVENVRPGGPIGQAEPELRRRDVILAVERQPVAGVAELRAFTDRLFAGAERGTHAVLVSLRRAGAQMDSVVELRFAPERNMTPQARKAWLGAETQPLTAKLQDHLGFKADGGVRIMRVYPGTQAAAADLRVDDLVLALDGIPVSARRLEDTDALARQIRQYRPGTRANFTVWRAGKTLEVPVVLELQPVPAAEMPWWEDERLEFSVHDLAFEDRVKLQLGPEATGVLVENATPAGWAALAGIRLDDIVLAADGRPIARVDQLRQARDDAVRSGRKWWVLLIQRAGQTQFVEINLKQLKP